MTERKQLPRAPENEIFPARLTKDASRQALAAQLRAAKQKAAPQKENRSLEAWPKRHPLLSLVLLLPASLVLGFGGVEAWMSLARMHLFNPFADWFALTVWILCSLWWAFLFFVWGAVLLGDGQ